MKSSFAVLFCFFALLTISCKKDLKQDGSPETAIQQYQGNDNEQAYPGLNGPVHTTKFNGKEIYVTEKGGRYVWMGDIAFDRQTFDSLKKAALAPNARTFKPTTNNHWWHGEVYFVIQPGFSQFEQTMISDAMTDWQNNTSLRFIPRTNQPNYVVFVPGAANSGLYSDYIGMKGGVQIINLESGSFITGNVIHEIGHVAGFYHEQCRTDRGNAINVFYDRVVPNNTQTIYQFRTYGETGESGEQIGAFDFGSVMLYGSFAFSNGVNPVMTRLDGTTFNGQRFGLSGGDIETANYIYGPPFARFTQVYTGGYDDGQRSGWTYDNILSFFADAACTQPVTLNETKVIRLLENVEEFRQGQGSTYWSNPVTVTLNPGNHEYVVGQTVGEQYVDGSYNTLYFHLTNYSATGAYVR
jgi:hypothetical protein